MSVKYKYSGLTEELYQRLVSEHAALRKTHKKGSYKQFFQEVKQCNELQARIIYQAFNSAVVERGKPTEGARFPVAPFQAKGCVAANVREILQR